MGIYCEKGHAEGVEWLMLKTGANCGVECFRSQDGTSLNALGLVIEKDHFSLIHFLLRVGQMSCGAECKRYSDGTSLNALALAMDKNEGRETMVEMLLKEESTNLNGACKMNVNNSFSRNPISIAIEKHDMSVLRCDCVCIFCFQVIFYFHFDFFFFNVSSVPYIFFLLTVL